MCLRATWCDELSKPPAFVRKWSSNRKGWWCKNTVLAGNYCRGGAEGLGWVLKSTCVKSANRKISCCRLCSRSKRWKYNWKHKTNIPQSLKLNNLRTSQMYITNSIWWWLTLKFKIKDTFPFGKFKEYDIIW